jgi:hypothetical protein
VVKAALEFFATYPDDGVLLHYGEYVMLECRGGEVVIDSGFEEFMETRCSRSWWRPIHTASSGSHSNEGSTPWSRPECGRPLDRRLAVVH